MCRHTHTSGQKESVEKYQCGSVCKPRETLNKQIFKVCLPREEHCNKCACLLAIFYAQRNNLLQNRTE